jgi:hypothetical protein
MSERDQMLGRLSVLEQERLKLRMAIEGKSRVIREAINPALNEPENMDIALAAAQMDELVMAQANLLAVGSKIARLKKELGING